MRTTTYATLLLTLSATALLGCSDNGGAMGQLNGPSQVVARVNGEEISLLQYRRALKLARVENPSPAVHQEIVDKLVDRELAVARSLELQLERQPDVLVELSEGLKKYEFDIKLAHTNAALRLKQPWLVKANVDIDERGRPMHVFLETRAESAGVNAVVVRALYQGRLTQVGTACEGSVTLSWPGLAPNDPETNTE